MSGADLSVHAHQLRNDEVDGDGDHHDGEEEGAQDGVPVLREGRDRQEPEGDEWEDRDPSDHGSDVHGRGCGAAAGAGVG